MVPIATDINETFYTLEGLKPGTGYAWKIIATDGQAISESPTWVFATKPPNPDLNSDRIVNFKDFAILASHWREPASHPDWCEGADFDRSKEIDFTDLCFLTNNWLREGNTIYVPADYLTIQEAVDVANSGDSIIVYPGTYTENVDVNKGLTIQSVSGPNSTIVQAANPDDHVFEVSAGYVNITGFTVKGATGTTTAKAGIYLTSDACKCRISENILSSNKVGIQLWHSSGNALTNNKASDMLHGISLGWSPSNILEGNILSRNSWGIYLQSSSNNALKSNRFIEDGLYIADTK